jgi:hypothetical protein
MPAKAKNPQGKIRFQRKETVGFVALGYSLEMQTKSKPTKQSLKKGATRESQLPKKPVFHLFFTSKCQSATL